MTLWHQSGDAPCRVSFRDGPSQSEGNRATNPGVGARDESGLSLQQLELRQGREDGCGIPALVVGFHVSQL